jgi:hypothetical protein
MSRQVFARPHVGIASPLGWSASWLDCPNKVAGATSARRDFAIDFRAFFLKLSHK